MDKKIGILYLHHVGVAGGSSRSLLSMVSRLAGKSIRPHFVAKNGPNTEILNKNGWPNISVKGLSQFDNSAHGFYKGKRWIIILRELVLLPHVLWAIFKAKRKWKSEIDMIHANEFSLVPVAFLTWLIFKKPVIIHVRALQKKSNRRRSRFLGKICRYGKFKIVAIDSAVANTLPDNIDFDIIHNGEQIRPFETQKSASDFKDRPLRIGMVANYIENKGVLDFVDAAAICINEYQLKNIEFQIVGDSQRKFSGFMQGILNLLGFSHDVKAMSIDKIDQYGIKDKFHLRGFISNVKDIYSEMDIHCFPSHLDTIGRPVFEAAMFGLPSIICLRVRQNHDAMVIDETCLVTPEKNPRALAEAILELYKDHNRIQSMGEKAYNHVKNVHDIEVNTEKLNRLYKQIASK